MESFITSVQSHLQPIIDSITKRNADPALVQLSKDLYKVGLSRADFFGEDKEGVANEIANAGVMRGFSCSVVEQVSVLVDSEKKLKKLELLTLTVKMTLNGAFLKLTADEVAKLAASALAEKSKEGEVRGELFVSTQTLEQFGTILHHLMKQYSSLVRVSNKHGESTAWFDKLIASGIAISIPYFFPFLPPSASFLSGIIKKWFPGQRNPQVIAGYAIALILDTDCEAGVSFPSMPSDFEWELFPKDDWFQAIKFPAKKLSTTPEKHDDFLFDVFSSIIPAKRPEFVPFPIGRLFTASQQILSNGKSQDQEHSQLKLICHLSVSESNALPNVALFLSTRQILGNQKFLQNVKPDPERVGANHNVATTQRMVSFCGHLMRIFDYHITFWKIFIDKTMFNFQLPFYLFENFYMEIYALTKFHIKSVFNLVQFWMTISKNILTELFLKNLLGLKNTSFRLSLLP
jgi:hypothetical protein